MRSAAAAASHGGRRERGMKKILVVDDSKTALLMSQMILEGHEYKVILARDGQEAIDRAMTDEPDLILLDLVMPNMDGLVALRAIRSIEAVHGVPVIVVSTRSAADFVERSYELGCNDYVTKPVDGFELLAKIRSLIGE